VASSAEYLEEEGRCGATYERVERRKKKISVRGSNEAAIR
jgi:hypothetical protein